MKTAAETNLKRVTLELGGKSPLIVCDDFDRNNNFLRNCNINLLIYLFAKIVDTAVTIAHNACFTNVGQNCCAGTRTFVQSTIYNKFVEKSVEMARSRKIGDPFDTSTNHGPQIDDKQMKKILDLIETGICEGAELKTGGKRHGNVGYFIEPTVFSNVKDEMTIAKEEIFGPVQSIFKFETIEEAIKRANNTRYGLGAGILTQSLSNINKFKEEILSGTVWINCYDVSATQVPFGGFKMSGFGRDL